MISFKENIVVFLGIFLLFCFGFYLRLKSIVDYQISNVKFSIVFLFIRIIKERASTEGWKFYKVLLSLHDVFILSKFPDESMNLKTDLRSYFPVIDYPNEDSISRLLLDYYSWYFFFKDYMRQKTIVLSSGPFMQIFLFTI